MSIGKPHYTVQVRRLPRLSASALALFFCLSSGVLLTAQVTTGIISGTVKDPSEAVLPGVTVKVSNLETGAVRTAATGTRGEYRIVSLPVGSYQVEASFSGFQTDIRRGIQLSIGRDAVVDFSLKVGDVAEKITVTGEAPLIETTTATVSGLVSPDQMRDIPLNARSFLDLVPLQAGATIAVAGTQNSGQGFGVKLSIAGTRYTSSVFLLDGAVINDFFNGAGSAAGTVAGVETVREFRVITNAFDAEYGRHTGGVISAITKSGTNQFHGSAFEFLRNDNLDTRNFFDRDLRNPQKRSSPPEYKRNQFGGSLGGPLIRDRTFLFGSYEGLREGLGTTFIFNVPGINARNGRLGGQFVGVNAAVNPFLQAYPVPNTPDRPDGTAQFVGSSTRITDENFWTVRADHRFSDSDSLFGRLTVDNAQRTVPALNGFNTTEVDGTASRFATLEETHIFSPALLDRTHFSFSRTHNSAFDIATKGYVFPKFAFGGAPDVPGRIIVTGLTQWGGNLASPKDQHQNLFQFKEDVFFSSGRHSLKFGFYRERLQFNERLDSSAGGTFTFLSLPAFVSGQVDEANFIQPGSDNIRGWRQNLFGLYAQDDIALRKGLSLNLGLRYEFITTPREVNGKVASIRDVAAPHIYTVKPNETDVGDPYFLNPSLRNFAPRVGFAWAPFKSGKTTLRGGFGTFHEQILPTLFVLAGVRAAPFYSVATIFSRDLAIDFPNSYVTQVSRGVTGGALPQIDGWQYNISQPAVYKWNLDLQQQIGAGMALTAGYSASRGTHLMRGSLTLNATPSTILDGRRFILIQQPLPNPYWTRMRAPAFDGSSNYHSLQITVNDKIGRRLQVHGAYTFSKVTDEGALIQGGNDFGVADRSSFGWEKEHGLAAFDVRQSLYTSFVYDLPGGNLKGILSPLLGGWGIAGLIRLNSGYPMNPNATQPTLGSLSEQFVGGGTLDLIPGGNQNSVRPQNPDQYFDVTQFRYPTPFFVGNVGRNVLIAPGIANVDFTLTKDTRFPVLGEGGSLQFRAEFFNLFNRPNFGAPALNLFTNTGARRSNAGQITTTGTPSRQIQFALKVLF